jgi:thiosulfate/3-mercaptopyruvate sulfurtransferase
MIHSTLVSTDILAEHLDGSWAIVDCRFDLRDDAWGRGQYRAAHVPGAMYASLNDDLAGDRTGTNGRHPVPPVDALAATLGRLGIRRGVTQVAVYDQDSGLYASRLWWSLRYLGHDPVALLDGGWAKWLREGRPTRAGDESRAQDTFTPDARPSMRAALDEVAARSQDGEARLIDARGPERFEGASEPLDRVAGHIPGAVNHFYKWNLAEDGTMLPPAALRDRFERVLAGRPPDHAIMYCGSGVSACHNLLAMEHAGMPGTRLYPGSWSEWSSDPARPVEKGPSARR